MSDRILCARCGFPRNIGSEWFTGLCNHCGSALIVKMPARARGGAWSWIVATVLAALLAFSGASAQTKIPGTGFTLRPGARAVKTQGQPEQEVNLACDPFAPDGNAPKPNWYEEHHCRYGPPNVPGNVRDAPGEHSPEYSGCLELLWAQDPASPTLNLQRPAGDYDGRATRREEWDAYMTFQGRQAMARCRQLRGVMPAADLAVSVPALSYVVNGLPGRTSAPLAVEAGVNRRWAVSASSPVVLGASGARSEHLSLSALPKRGTGPATLEVVLEVRRGAAPGRYTGTVILSGGTLKIPVPVAITVGEPEVISAPPPMPIPDDGGPIPAPACEVAVKVTEASTGRISLTIAVPPCVQEKQ